MRIAVVDYGSGNLTSVAGAIRAIGFEPMVTAETDAILEADRIILPGVGAFGDCMRQLRATGMTEVLEKAKGTRPILGICVGAQLMCRESEEHGHNLGLGWIDATVRMLRPVDPGLRVPHVGWDDVARPHRSALFDDIPADALFYYVHSFAIHCACEDIVIGTCDYGGSFAAAFQVGSTYGVQFHPEKSQQCGLMVLRNFITKTG
jgi:glutamine amidotransferase